MRKRVDHDATQEVSSSQLVPDAKPPAFTGPKNDASMWLQAPVSADDFVGMPKKKAGSRGGRGLVIGVFAVLLVGVSVAGVYYAILRPPDLQPAASVSGESATSPAPVTPTPAAVEPAVAPALADAGADLVAASPDAGVDGDTGVGSAAALTADAVSAADPVIKKKSPKKRTKKKTAKKTKKKTSSKRR